MTGVVEFQQVWPTSAGGGIDVHPVAINVPAAVLWLRPGDPVMWRGDRYETTHLHVSPTTAIRVLCGYDAALTLVRKATTLDLDPAPWVQEGRDPL